MCRSPCARATGAPRAKAIRPYVVVPIGGMSVVVVWEAWGAWHLGKSCGPRATEIQGTVGTKLAGKSTQGSWGTHTRSGQCGEHSKPVHRESRTEEVGRGAHQS